MRLTSFTDFALWLLMYAAAHESGLPEGRAWPLGRADIGEAAARLGDVVRALRNWLALEMERVCAFAAHGALDSVGTMVIVVTRVSALRLPLSKLFSEA